MTTKTIQKLFSVFTCFSLLANSLYAPASVLAQELTPEPTPVATEAPAQTPEATVEPSATPIESPVPTEEPTPTPTVEATPIETSTPSESSQPQAPPVETTNPTSSSSPTPSPVPSTEPEVTEPALETQETTLLNQILTTGKLDYLPHETVDIHGQGLLPVSVYTLVISSEDEPAISFSTSVITDLTGSFNYDYELDGNYRPNYLIELIDSNGTLVTSTNFTDADTGFKNPTSNSSNDSGSGDDWDNPTNAYSNGGGAASEQADERHRFYDYNFGVPSGAVIDGIEVAVDTWSSDNTGCQLGVDLSWNGGSNWSTEKVQNLTGSEATYTLGSNSDKWGSHTWVSSDFTNANFRSRVRDIDPGQNCNGNPSLDWIRVKVHYTEAQLPDLTVTKTNNVNGTVVIGSSFVWTITVTNLGPNSVSFSDNQDVLQDNLPDSDDTDYSPENNISVNTAGGVTGDLDCDIDNGDNLDCDADGTFTIPSGGSFSLSITVTPEETGTFENPRDGQGNKCQVDPDGLKTESNEQNNFCEDNVEVTDIVIEENPTLPNSCGLDIALVIDSSGSISDSELSQMKTAFLGFVNALLPGTPTQFSVTEFDTSATVTQSFTNNTTLINNAINGAASGGYTNWEDGLAKAQGTFDPTGKPNLVIFASDGNPNRVDNGDSVDEDQAVNEAILVANSIKSSGTRVVALGIGNELDLDNLKAISGPTTGTTVASDVITSNFDTLASDLATYANELCGGKITVTKMIDNQVQSGWTYSVNVTGGSAQPSSGATGQDGTVQFDITPSNGSATVDVTETVQSGYSVASASCTKNNQSAGTFDQVDGVNGISMDNDDIVSCVFNNRLSQGGLTVNKQVDADGNGTYEGGNTEANTLGFDWGIDAETPARNMGTTLAGITEGVHSVTENSVANYSFTGWYTTANEQYSCTNPEGTELPSVTIIPGQTLAITLCNALNTGEVDVTKYEDLDADGEYDEGEPTLSGWTINLEGKDSQETGEDGETTFEDVVAGSHELSENLEDGWYQSGIACFHYQEEVGQTEDDEYYVEVEPGETVNCYIGNYRLGSVDGYKWNDENQNGERDFGFDGDLLFFLEDKLEGWTIVLHRLVGEGSYIYDTTVTDESGNYSFENLEPGNYRVCEELQSGWTQTYPEGCHDFTIISGGNEDDMNFGNFEREPGITIVKTNNKPTVGQNDTVTYTLVVTNTGNVDVYGLEVIDALPGGFTYVSGSTDINGSDSSDPDPTGGVLTWNLGYLPAESSVIITYEVKTPSDLTPGIYTNLATCNAFNRGETILTRVIESDILFIEGEPNVECDPTSSTVTMNGNQNYGGNIEGQVLGASTMLPGTGSETAILVGALAVLGFGLGFKLISRRKYAKN